MSNVVANVAAALLAVLLVVAGTIKLRSPRFAASSLRRVVGARVFRSWSLEPTARALGMTELGLGAALVTVGGPASILVASLAAGVFSGFVLVTRVAVRRGVSCGCWGSLSDGVAGKDELRRRLLFAGAGMALVLLRWYRTPPPVPPFLAVIVIAGAVIAGLMLARRDGRLILLRLVSGAAFGVYAAGSVATKLSVPRRIRRRVIDELRRDVTVRAVEAELDAVGHLAWRHALVTAPQNMKTNRLVSVPGDGVSLRVVLMGDRPAAVLGETDQHIIIGKNGGVTAKPKTSRPGTARAAAKSKSSGTEPAVTGQASPYHATAGYRPQNLRRPAQPTRTRLEDSP